MRSTHQRDPVTSGGAARGILHVIAPAPVGGLEQVIRTLAAGQASRGWKVDVAALVTTADHEFTAAWDNEHATLHPIVLPARAYRTERRVIGSLVRTLNPAVVHTHGYRCDVIDAPAARRNGVPTVTTVHGFTGGGLRNRIYELLQLRAFRRFDGVIAVSNALQHAIVRSGVNASRVHTIPNAHGGNRTALSRDEARRVLGLGDGFVAGWVGRLSREKGPDVFVDALRLLTDLPVRVAVVGEGPMRHELETRARAAGVADRIRWLGRLPDAARYFAAFDAFVLSSRTEGTPITLLEAMSAGVPIVATTVGGVPDVVSDTNARLVPPERPDALAAAIREIVSDPAAATARASNARERLHAHYDVDTWLDRYDAVYRSIIA